MPLRLEQTATGTDTTFASTVSATFANKTQAGSIILLAWEGDTGAANAANTPTDTTGNTYSRVISKSVSATFDLEIWYAINKAATNSNVVTVTDTIGGSDGCLIIEEWTGADSVTTTDKSSSNNGSGSPLTPSSISTAQPNELIWVAGVESVGAADLSASSPNINLTQTNTSFSNLGICSQVVAAQGSFNNGFTSIVSVAWACAQVSIRRQPEGTTTSTSSTSISSTSSSTTSVSASSTSVSSSTSSTSASTTSVSTSSTSSSLSTSSTSSSISSTSSSTSSTSSSSTSSSTSISSTSSSISSTSISSTSASSTSSSTSVSSTSSSFSSTSSSISSTSSSTSSTSVSSTSSSLSTSTTTVPAPYINYSYQDDDLLPSNTVVQKSMNANQIAKTTTIDGDYFVQYGSEYMVQQFKKTWTNNTDNPSIVITLRSTISPQVSPVLLQIYNQNTTTWETIDTETLQLADVDFVLNGGVTTNVSNYYDTTNTVTFRVYQQVF